MNLLKKNIAANFVGTIWQSLMSLAFIPLYIKFMGIEAWGLIGIFATLQVIFGLLDMGLSSTLNREMARLSVIQDKEQEMRNLVRTLEVVYWIVAVLIGMLVVALSPLITHYWIITDEFLPKTIAQAIIMMGFIIAIQMPVGFYSGGLLGLQKQVLLNTINVCVSTLRGVGAVLILWLISPTIQAYFLWQIVISIVNVFLLVLCLWRNLPKSKKKKAVFEKKLFKGIWRFAAGMSGISILSVILTQLDKIILCKMLSLEMFGYYMLASVVSMSIIRLVIPIFSSIYPKFTQLVFLDDQEGLKQLYHKICQFISVLILPVAVVIALFSYEVLFLWTQNETTADKSFFLLSILISGTALNGVMHIPYALQLSFGWTKLSFFKNVLAVILFVPLIIFMTSTFGAIGAASTWAILNLGYVFFEIPIMHHWLLRGEKWKWYFQDICLPLVAGLSVAISCRLFFDESMSQFMMMLYLLIVSALTLSVTAIATPVTRHWLLNNIVTKFNKGLHNL